jgi:hypothetical protein
MSYSIAVRSNILPPYGTEKIVNGGFDDTSWWINNGGAEISIANGVCTYTNAAASSNIQTACSFTVGHTYIITFDINSISGANIRINQDGGAGKGTTGQYTCTFVDNGSGVYIRPNSPGLNAVIDNVSCKEVLTNVAGITPVVFYNKLTGWTNVDFDTFTSSGKVISSAIEAGGTYGRCKTNAINIKGGLNGAYGYIQLKAYITLNSGTCPRISYYKNDVFQGSTAFTYTVPGYYNVGYLISEDNNYAMGFINENGALATDFTVSDAILYSGDNYIQI